MAETHRKPFEARRSGGPRALAVSLSQVTRKALQNRSLAERSLIVDWPEVVGPETAAICHPVKLSFARRDRRMDGTLALRVRSGQATRHRPGLRYQSGILPPLWTRLEPSTPMPRTA